MNSVSDVQFTRSRPDLADAGLLGWTSFCLAGVQFHGVGMRRGDTMWARVKGATENTLLSMPFKASYMLRPAAVRPVHGERSRATTTRVGYALFGWLVPVVSSLFPKYVTTTERLARAMLHLARHGAPTRVLESADIDQLGRQASLAHT
jgi:hypothetical protein